MTDSDRGVGLIVALRYHAVSQITPSISQHSSSMQFNFESLTCPQDAGE